MTEKQIQELEALDQALLRRDGGVTHSTLADTVRDLRVAATNAARREYPLSARRRTRTVRLRWMSALTAAAGTAMALIVVLVPLKHGEPKIGQESAAVSGISDDSLLTAVQSDLSASVPSPMEALTPTANTTSSNPSSTTD